jgi:hypothetical protein
MERAFKKKVIGQLVSANWIECLTINDIEKIL